MQLNRCIVLLGQLNRLTRLESYNCRKRNLIEALSYVSLSLYSEWVLIFWRSTDILYLIYICIWNLVWFARAISRCEGSRCWFSNNSLNAFRIRIRIRCRSPHAMPIEVKLSQNYVHIRPPNRPLKTRDPRRTRVSSCPKWWFIGDALRNQRSNRSAVTSTSSRFSSSSQGPATSSSTVQLYIQYLYICSYTVIGFFDLTLIQLKSYAIESMLKLLERSEGCVQVCLSVGKRSHC